MEMNLPDGVIWDVFDVTSGRRLMHNATNDDVARVVAWRPGSITLDPIGMAHERERLHGRQDKERS